MAGGIFVVIEVFVVLQNIFARVKDNRPHAIIKKIISFDINNPDFVVKLKDGRILVVEYNGADRYSNDDSKEKRIIGESWAKNSNGQCLFVMTNGTNITTLKDAVGEKYAN